MTGTTPSTGSTGSTGPTSTSTSADSTGSTFLQPLDFGCLGECDPFLLDSCCDPNLKCTAYANDGGGSWNALKCVPVARDPDQPGEPCTVEGDAVSGIDSCDNGAMCWDVDGRTLAGVCVALCTGTADNPVCAAGTTCVLSNDGVLALCLPTCNPLVQDCPDDDLCIADDMEDPGFDFVCVFDGSGDMGQAFDPCEFLNVCDKGLACIGSDNSALCDPMVSGCCLPFCDLSLPVCPGDTMCVPWYAMGMATPGHENVGVCGKLP